MTVIRYRSSAGLTSRSVFCQGWPVGTNTTSSSPKRPADLAGGDEVAVVDGVERPTHHPDPPACHRSSLAGTAGAGPADRPRSSVGPVPRRSAVRLAPGNAPTTGSPVPPVASPCRPGCAERAGVTRWPSSGGTALDNERRRGYELRGPLVEIGAPPARRIGAAGSERGDEVGQLGGVAALDHVDDLAVAVGGGVPAPPQPARLGVEPVRRARPPHQVGQHGQPGRPVVGPAVAEHEQRRLRPDRGRPPVGEHLEARCRSRCARRSPRRRPPGRSGRRRRRRRRPGGRTG